MDASLLHQLFHQSPMATLVLDAQNRIVFANEAARQLVFIGDEHQLATFFSNEPLPEIVQGSTGIKLSIAAQAELAQLKHRDGHVFTAEVVRQRFSTDLTLLYLRDLTAMIGYWGKLHRQNHVENQLVRSQRIREGKLDDALLEVVRAASACLNAGRVNIWLFKEQQNSITTIMNYDRDNDRVLPEAILKRKDIPSYFKLLESEEIIITNDSANDERTKEIVDSYILVNGVKSMMDIPIRIEGKVIGLICFEETQALRKWDVAEQKFALSIAQIIAQTIETHRRQETQIRLEQSIDEKKLLLREVNDRTRNNFMLISDILKLQAETASNETQRQFIEALRLRLNSMMMIHRQLYQTENIQQINFRDFLLDFTSSFRTSYSTSNIHIHTLIDTITLPMGKALFSALIIHELMTNACMHAFGQQKDRQVTLQVQQRGNNVTISVKDNGNGHETPRKEEATGMKLVRELCAKINAKLLVDSSQGYTYTIVFPL